MSRACDVVYAGSNSSSPTVVHVIPTKGNQVLGVTSLGDDVFVVRANRQQKIEVYDAKTFTLQRHITVAGLGDHPAALAACPHNNCLYASTCIGDGLGDSVHRLELSDGSKAVMKWSVAWGTAGLSVNTEHNLIVVSGGASKLQICTTHGTLLQDIQLQLDVKYSHSAVQLPSGKFAVSHAWLGSHRVCLVDADGDVVRSYGGAEGSELTQMNFPRGLHGSGRRRTRSCR